MSDAAIWAQTLLAVAVISGLSLVGSVTLVLAPRALKRMLVLLVPFAAGALLGDAFLHLVPEIAESDAGFNTAASLWLLGGITAFFLLEKVLHWHHAHFPSEEVVHPVAVSNIAGDSIHNFVDGAIVASSFIASPALGLATTIAVSLHEIPQELGDFAILVHAGMKPKRALRLNFLTSLAAVAGGMATLLVSSTDLIESVFLPFSAGAFVYIASTDLIPELHKEPEPAKSLLQSSALIAGIGVMAVLAFVE